ncbi:hypothetical protein A3C96_00250 [Candidatus Uhrbacteria bacterium RIFCSPHIGHO2_02_FULL_60_10]|uniref:Uncharacterized protein n=1 Tax=Candidatus Uhrbacteria bacterium RIFCSPHIGHO2_02_FULL_60_10 TaxID=1802392 RepID=A0A1F7U765_9BACT|nr:MAG: hypothetical protein A3C96_00250 [Candidatus Uhrbacteria bacterium RIFCSPHIGHO2_02_FULL_60_10]
MFGQAGRGGVRQSHAVGLRGDGAEKSARHGQIRVADIQLDDGRAGLFRGADKRREFPHRRLDDGGGAPAYFG